MKKINQIEFVNENIFKLDIMKYEGADKYNDWLGIIWCLKSLGADKSIVKSWCKAGPSYNESSFEQVWNHKFKGHDDFNLSFNRFLKESRT